MADTEVKSSASLGANEPPSPSPSATPATPLPDAPMRVNHVQPLPTPSSAYRAIANLIRGFEQDRRNLAALQEFNFFPEKNLLVWGNMLGRLQADANLRLQESLHERLMNNALYYDRLCWVREADHRVSKTSTAARWVSTLTRQMLVNGFGALVAFGHEILAGIQKDLARGPTFQARFLDLRELL